MPTFRFPLLPIFIVASSFLLIKCKKTPTPSPVLTASTDVLLINESAFGSGNGSLSLWRRKDSTVVADVFQTKNQQALGDVVQSYSVLNGKGWIVVNNSQRVMVVDTSDFGLLQTITMPNLSPRYICAVSPTKFYISNFTLNGRTHLSALNPTTYTVENVLETGWIEQMVLASGQVFAAERRSSHIIVINPTTNAPIDTITVPESPQEMRLDANGRLWVRCNADLGGTASSLVCVNTTNFSIEKTFSLPANAPISLISLNKLGDRLFYLQNNAVYSMGINETTLPNAPLFTTNLQYGYALGIDPLTGDIWLSDARGFNTKSTVYRYSSTGALRQTIEGGIGTNGFHF